MKNTKKQKFEEKRAKALDLLRKAEAEANELKWLDAGEISKNKEGTKKIQPKNDGIANKKGKQRSIR